MPKYGIHSIVIKEAAAELQSSPHDSARKAADIIHNQMPSAVMGSIGPDIFFWGPDYEAVKKIYRLYENWKKLSDIYHKIVDPIEAVIDAVGEPVEEAVETLAPNTVQMIRHLLEEIDETADLFKSALGTNLFAGVIQGADILTDAAGLSSLSQEFFKMFEPKYHLNEDEKSWYWFEMLHYRRTGDFAANLVNGSSNRTERQKAFAFGYLSHIATDITGHPFINKVCGTSYRRNVQRHVTSENFMDVWKFKNNYNENINHTLFDRLGLPSLLPTDIGDLLFETFNSTYNGASIPDRLPGGYFTRAQIDETYDVFYKVLSFMKGQAVNRPEEPFSGVADILEDALGAFSAPPSPPSSFSSACSLGDILSFGLTADSRDCYDEFFEELDEWFDYLGELIKWGLETLRNLIDLLLAIFLSLPVTVLIAILYGIQIMCYNLYRSARSVLAINGFVYPEPDELETSIGRNMTTTFQCRAHNFKTFPSISTPQRSNVVCPVPQAEKPTTAANYAPFSNLITPDWFIRDVPLNEQLLAEYADSSTPEMTIGIEQTNQFGLGNATDLTAWLVRHANDPNNNANTKKTVFANWNLDADRGYGYLAWEGKVPHDAPYQVNQEKYV